MTEKNSSKLVRDFIYLDRERMYSLYSQLFEGVVETMARSVTSGTGEDKKDHKLEETIFDASTKVQNVILFDHIYNMLEEKMTPDLMLVDVNTNIDEIKPDSIIKITGYARIEDYDYLLHILDSFNEIGSAAATITLKKDDTSKQVSKNQVDQYAKNNNLYLDKKFSESLTKLIDEIHGKTMEIVIPVASETLNADFKAFINKKHLRISQESLKDIYGFAPCMEWTMVGEVTDLSYRNPNTSLKDAGVISSLLGSLTDLTTSFSALTGERKTVRIAPIAIYIEHRLSAGATKSEGTNATHEI